MFLQYRTHQRTASFVSYRLFDLSSFSRTTQLSLLPFILRCRHGTTIQTASMANHIPALQVELKDLSIGISLCRSAEVESVPNFPIPVELRNNIYRHLLLGVRTRYQPQNAPGQYTSPVNSYTSAAHLYHFHTNILAVNKQIHDEASNILYKENTFVVLSSKSPSFEYFRNITDVPIVSVRFAGRMKHHAMRLHFAWATPPLKLVQAQSGANSRTWNKGIQALIMLHEDLPRLCCMLQSQYCLSPQTQTIMQKTALATFFVSMPKDTKMVNLKIELRTSPYREMTEDLDRDLLEPFQSVVSAGQIVTITGSRPDITNPLQDRMVPDLIWASGMLWSLYHTTRTLKDAYDNLALAGKYREAIFRYSFLMSFIGHETMTPLSRKDL